MSYTDAQLLNMDGIPSRTDAFRFDVVTPAGAVIGTTPVRQDSAPTITNDYSSPTMRTMQGFSLSPSDSAALNTRADLIRPVMILENGTEFPLGRFVFTDTPRARSSAGLALTGAQLGDMWTAINVPNFYGASYDVGTPCTDIITDVLTATVGPEAAANVPSLPQVISTPLIIADTQGQGDVLRAQLTNVGYIGYFDNTGAWTMRPQPDPSTLVPTLMYAEGGTIIDGTITESDSSLSAPDKFKVSDNTSQFPLVAYYYVPATSPVYERPFSVPYVASLQGLSEQPQADEAVAGLAASVAVSFEQVTFSASTDPRHDTLDVVGYRENAYLEQRWSMTCAAGGPMQHTLRRVYAP